MTKFQIGDTVTLNFREVNGAIGLLEQRLKIVGINLRNEELKFVSESYDVEFDDGFIVRSVTADKLLRIE
jgi:hypothetical protein